MTGIPLLLVVLTATPAPSTPALAVWSANYTDALKQTQDTDKPLLVVIHDPANPKSRSQHATDKPDETQAELLKHYELCRIDATTVHGKRVAEAFKVESFPFMAVIDKSGTGVLCQYTGQMEVEQWVEKLVAYKADEKPAARVAVATTSSNNVSRSSSSSSSKNLQLRRRRSSSITGACYT